MFTAARFFARVRVTINRPLSSTLPSITAPFQAGLFASQILYIFNILIPFLFSFLLETVNQVQNVAFRFGFYLI